MINITALIVSFGYIGIAIAIFAESGLLVGIFFPGDSLLFTAGFLASQHILQIFLLCLIATVCAIGGDSVGYWLGKKFGPTVFSREDGIFFRKQYITRAESFYRQYGSKTIFLARFIPVIRTLAPTLAGVGNMPYTTFLSYNILGGIIWGSGLPLAGYWLGSIIPGVDQYLLPIIVFIIVLSITPGAYHFWREYRKSQ